MAASQILLTNGSTPETPASGKTAIFVNTSKQFSSVDDAGAVQVIFPGQLAVSQSTPADPAGTTDTAGKMMGLAGSITPVATGRVLIIISGNLTNSTAAAGDGAKAQIRYGTGTAPVNAAALTGTAIGNQVSMLLERATASDPYPFSIQAIVTGLSVGTSYWIDLALAAIAGGTGVAKNISVSAIEI